MKRMSTIILIFLFSIPAFAPAEIFLPIPKAEPIRVFDPMLYSFQFVESSFDTDTVNSLGYGGILQIGQEMVDEANRICILTGNPACFVLDDRLDSTKSVQMWYIAQNYWNPKYELRKACKIWNPMASEKYYLKLKKMINNL